MTNTGSYDAFREHLEEPVQYHQLDLFADNVYGVTQNNLEDPLPPVATEQNAFLGVELGNDSDAEQRAIAIEAELEVLTTPVQHEWDVDDHGRIIMDGEIANLGELDDVTIQNIPGPIYWKAQEISLAMLHEDASEYRHR